MKKASLRRANATKQSILALLPWIASLALAMTAHSAVSALSFLA
jgi:hypothetical protein